jgi:hypothetical protein
MSARHTAVTVLFRSQRHREINEKKGVGTNMNIWQYLPSLAVDVTWSGRRRHAFATPRNEANQRFYMSYITIFYGSSGKNLWLLLSLGTLVHMARQGVTLKL